MVGSQPAAKDDLGPQGQQQLSEDCLRFLTSKGNLRFPKRSEETGMLCKERANERAASRSRSQAASEVTERCPGSGPECDTQPLAQHAWKGLSLL